MQSYLRNLCGFSLAGGLLILGVRTTHAVDCNGNGVEDALDLFPQNFGFLELQSYAVGFQPWSLIAADFNGDGEPDLATANARSGDVSILLSQGKGAFNYTVSYSVGDNLFSLIAVDFNGDGRPDLAVTFVGCRRVEGCGGNADEGVAILLNQGDGTFLDAVPYPSAGGGYLTAADVNGDGAPDLVTSDGSVLLNLGDGTFKDAVSYTGLEGITIAADFDGDGAPDLVTSNGSVFLNHGDGTFRDAVIYPAEGDNLIAADVNGDRKADLAMAQAESGDVTVLLNQGDGTFGDIAAYSAGEQAGSNIHEYFASIIAADLNGDDKLDLALTFGACWEGKSNGCSSGPVSVLLNKGNGTLADAVRYTLGGGWLSLIATDLNGDGKLDLAAAIGDHVSVLLNQTTPPSSLDLNNNAIPDECDLPPRPRFHRADPNSSGTTDISDAIAIFAYLFLGDAAPACKESADVQNDGRIDISDGISLLIWLLANGPAPAPPGPANAPCGVDPDAPGSVGDLGCVSFTGC